MKKINKKRKKKKKGFTLIELLAIIVILAIIMVVTIPTVLGSLGDAKVKTFYASANSSAEWIEKQYSIASIGDTMAGTVSTAFAAVCNSDGSACKDTTVTLNLSNSEHIAFLNASGIKASNYSAASVTLNDGRACIELKVNSSGDFANLKDKDGVAVTTANSSGCSATNLTQDERKRLFDKKANDVAKWIFEQAIIFDSGGSASPYFDDLYSTIKAEGLPVKIENEILEEARIENPTQNISNALFYSENETLLLEGKNFICVMLAPTNDSDFYIEIGNYLDGFAGYVAKSAACE